MTYIACSAHATHSALHPGRATHDLAFNISPARRAWHSRSAHIALPLTGRTISQRHFHYFAGSVSSERTAQSYPMEQYHLSYRARVDRHWTSPSTMDGDCLYDIDKRLDYPTAHTSYLPRPDSEMSLSCVRFSYIVECTSIENNVANSPADRQAAIIVVHTYAMTRSGPR